MIDATQRSHVRWSASRLTSIQGGGYMDRHRHFTSSRPAMFHTIGSASASTSTKNNFIATAHHVNRPVSPSSSFSTIITCAILSFAIAEILNYCGIFHDESGLEATRRKKKFLDEYMSSNKDFDSALECILDGMELWWVRHRFQKGGILQWSTWKERIQRGLDLYATRGFWGVCNVFASNINLLWELW
jgi:hypothetical protein